MGGVHRRKVRQRESAVPSSVRTSRANAGESPWLTWHDHDWVPRVPQDLFQRAVLANAHLLQVVAWQNEVRF